MDNTGALRGFPAFAIGPCFYFHFAGGDERFEVQQAVDGFNQSVAAAFFQAEVFEEHLLFFVSFQFGNVGLGLCGDDDELGVFAFDGFAHLLYVLVAVGGAGVVHVADVEHRFRCEQEHLLGALFFIVVLRYYGAGALSLFQRVFVAEQEFVLYLRHFVSAYFGYLFHALDAVFHRIEVFQLEFGIDDFLVAYRVYATVHVYDIDNIAYGGHDTSRMNDFGEFGQSLVGYGYLSHLGVDGTKRKVCRLCFCAGQAVEKSGFPYVGQSHYTCF